MKCELSQTPGIQGRQNVEAAWGSRENNSSTRGKRRANAQVEAGGMVIAKAARKCTPEGDTSCEQSTPQQRRISLEPKQSQQDDNRGYKVLCDVCGRLVGRVDLLLHIGVHRTNDKLVTRSLLLEYGMNKRTAQEGNSGKEYEVWRGHARQNSAMSEFKHARCGRWYMTRSTLEIQTRVHHPKQDTVNREMPEGGMKIWKITKEKMS
ncbi:unnamed protein product [Trypanosoma congolense IL3000]|uniref:WGS project CAEQ00000000 data, annotated contig 1665 n=1 Tax=Trypanosoma congolense (strain IL3000) TaxID=1068625 RepID=F9W7W7_TRYCI|nr:unnamed protein product [Trypanosoma congolense IL3000]